MKSILIKSFFSLTVLYLVYVLKWAIGIDIFESFHAPDFVKLPAITAVEGIQNLGFEVALPGQSTPDQAMES